MSGGARTLSGTEPRAQAGQAGAASRGRAGGWHLGAVPQADGTTSFRVWAPGHPRVDVVFEEEGEVTRTATLAPEPGGYHGAVIPDCQAGVRYKYRLGDEVYPDPASRHQVDGVHGPSEVVAPFDGWTDDAWHGLPLDETVLYELHIGTFTEEGTFDAAIRHLDTLVTLGITVVEVMPVAQFPGNRNWGYDGVFPFATQDSYGGPHGFARFVDACHDRGLAVCLDVVYNHLGPEGNVLHEYGPYFTSRYRTPWGDALNFDGRGSDEVRRYFIENARYWITDLHIDMLRLDAVHAINDPTARPFLHDLTEAVHTRARRLRRTVHLVAESAANDPRHLRAPEVGGFGMDAEWNDDFHHALQSLLTGERHGYYTDFGRLDQLTTAYTQGYVFTGEYSEYRGRRHGAPPHGIGVDRFVVYQQNHDQTGNRYLGERIATLTDFESLKLGAGLVCLAPSLPMLFMGEEHGEDRPFLYFTSHTDPELQEAVRKGRKEEGRRFGWTGEAPDPQDPQTFERSRVDHTKREQGHGRVLFDLYRHLLRLRRTVPAFRSDARTLHRVRSDPSGRILAVERRAPPDADDPLHVLLLYNFGSEIHSGEVHLPPGDWRRELDSAAEIWGGPGHATPTGLRTDGGYGAPVELPVSPRSFAIYIAEPPQSTSGTPGEAT